MEANVKWGARFFETYLQCKRDLLTLGMYSIVIKVILSQIKLQLLQKFVLW